MHNTKMWITVDMYVYTYVCILVLRPFINLIVQPFDYSFKSDY